MNLFNSAASKRPKMNAFDLSHDHLTAVNMGSLVPVLIEEVVPGDNFRTKTDVLVRCNPMIAPVMSRLDVKMEYFYVPNRIIWDQWEEFISRGSNGLSDITVPVVNSFDLESSLASIDVDASKPGSLTDYMGIPPFVSGSSNDIFSLLPFLAYQKIYNDYYRNPNFEDEVDLTPNGAANYELFRLRKRQWGRDYFTTALPWVQRGPEVTIPMGTSASVTGDIDLTTNLTGTLTSSVYASKDGLQYANDGTQTVGVDHNLEADLSDATAVTINDLRKASALQRWYEQAARVGSRYIDMIQGFFGIRPLDLRLDRPALIGSSSSPIRISEVLQTSSTDDDSAQGNMSGHGLSYSENFNKDYQCQDYGFIIGIMSIVPKATYMQGVRRLWRKNDVFEFYFPQFAQLGEQPVYNSELYYTGQENDPEGTFGYQSRYAEYKFSPSSVTGAFRDSLDYWHFARKFDSQPTLNEEFLQIENILRCFPVIDPEPGEENFYVQLRHHIKALRPMPVYNIPTLN